MKTVAMLLIGDVRMDGRVRKEILTLRTSGFRVVLIQWSLGAPADAGGDLGVDVIDFPYRLHRSPTVNFIRQIHFAFFALRHLRRLSPDFVQCNDLNTLLGGYLFRRRTRVIYDSHELFPESQSGIRRRIWSVLERWMVSGCYAYIHPERNRLLYFAAKYRIAPDRIALVENFPSACVAFSGQNRLREHFDLSSDVIVVLCPGVMGPGRNIESMIDCMAFLDDRFVLVLLGPTFKGYEKDLARRIANARSEDRVKLHPPVPNTEMLDCIQSSDIGLVFYPNTSLNNYWCASNKLYDFIYCGRPVVTNDYPGLRAVVEANGLGTCIADTSPRVIASALRDIASSWTRPAAPSPYVWERQEEAYIHVFE